MKKSVFGSPYLTEVNAVPCQYPWLSYHENCDVCIIGGGVTGALAAYRFSKAGINTILISENAIAYGATSISDGILEYDTANDLIGLSKAVGKQNAVKVFELLAESLNEVEAITKNINRDLRFARRNAFLYTEDKQHADYFHTEYLMRKHNGFDVQFVDKQKASNLFSFNVEAGILSKNLAGEIDVYLFAHALVEEAEKCGARIYENTLASQMIPETDGITILTKANKKIKAKKVILATGYEQNEHLGMIHKKTMFGLVTEPIKTFSGYDSRCIIRDDACPQTTIRTTSDDRLIISGMESTVVDSCGKVAKIINGQKIINGKYKELEEKLNKMFCAVTDMKAEYTYGGLCAKTTDLLPILGEQPDFPNIYFDFAGGSNALLFAEMGSRMLLDAYQGKQNPDLNLFSATRPSLDQTNPRLKQLFEKLQ